MPSCAYETVPRRSRGPFAFDRKSARSPEQNGIAEAQPVQERRPSPGQRGAIAFGVIVKRVMDDFLRQHKLLGPAQPIVD